VQSQCEGDIVKAIVFSNLLGQVFIRPFSVLAFRSRNFKRICVTELFKNAMLGPTIE
jgi:hypothetical protein